MNYIRLLRIPNLFIIALVQSILYFHTILPVFSDRNIIPVLDSWHFIFLVISTLCIASSGYIFNDLEDLRTDAINHKSLIINKEIPINKVWFLFAIILISGFGFSLAVAFKADMWSYLFLYPVSCLCLIAYSKYLQRKILLGNLIVAIFCAFVAGLVLLAENESLQSLKAINNDSYFYIKNTFYAFMAFGFSITLFREIIKDIEDARGDEKAGYKTLVILKGVQIAKILAGSVLSLLIVLLIIWGIYINDITSFISLIYFIGIVFFPLLAVAYYLYRSKSQKDFHLLSTMTKFSMLGGIMYLFFL